MKKGLSRMVSPQRARTNAKQAQNAAYNQAQIAAQSGQAPQNMGQFNRRQRTNLKQMAQGNYNPPASRMPAPPMVPPSQAPQFSPEQYQQVSQQLDQSQQMGIGNFMQNQMQPQAPQGMAIPRPIAGQGGGYGYNSQQMAQDPMQQPSQQGYFSNQADVASGKIPISQGKQWIRG